LNIYCTRNLTAKNPATDRWSSPEHILEVNSNFDDKMPAISPDGKTLIFSSNRPGGYGGFDIWVANRDKKDNKWSTPINLGAMINSSGNEIMPTYHFDGTTIYFSSDRKDENYKFSFYMADLDDDTLLSAEDGKERLKTPNQSPSMPRVKEVKKLSLPFNSKYDDEGISFTHDGMWVYYASNRPGGEGQFDIYRAPVTEDMRKPYAFDFSGLVVDGSETTMIGLDSTIKIFNEKGLVRLITSKRIGGDITTKKSDSEIINFKTKLLTGFRYKIEVSSPGFHPNEFSLDLTGNIGFGKSKYVRVILMPVREEEETKELPIPISSDKKLDKDLPKETPQSPQTPVSQVDSGKVFLKDFETKKDILEGSVKIFSDTQKDGFILPKEKDNFAIEKIPQGAFELTGSANGYSTETITVSKEDRVTRDKKVFEIYLKKTTEKKDVYYSIVLFDFSEYKIKEDQIPILSALIKYLQANPKDRLEISGHTDNIDSKDFNVKLSQKRADVIKDYIISKGIEEKRLDTRALWYSQPVADNGTEEGRAKNRRVTFRKVTK